VRDAGTEVSVFEYVADPAAAVATAPACDAGDADAEGAVSEEQVQEI
jgi:hypothetical protein